MCQTAVEVLSTALLLIRHGCTADNLPNAEARLSGWHDSPLNAIGLREAAALADALRFESVAALYSSPLTRARQTATELAAVWGLDPKSSPGLREISCGELEGQPVREVQRVYPDLWRRNMALCDEDFQWPGGESYRAFRQRVLESLASLAAAHRGQRIALVTHAGVISQVLGALHGVSAARWDLWRPENGSLTEVLWHPSDWRHPEGSVIRFGWRPPVDPGKPRSGKPSAGPPCVVVDRWVGGCGCLLRPRRQGL